MVVARKDDVDAIGDEQRLEQHTHVDRGTVCAAIRIQRMMEIADLPVLLRALQGVLEPGQFLLIDLVAVEREEPDVFRRVGVVPLARPCSTAGIDVDGIVMVAERGVELDARCRAALCTAARTS